ncbi:hypothetical protein EI94DRAFT_1871035 [Lactarius quietus]|nr:hypothetical protein EI94DRAFT_1871035 [Lactarius quietus]
MRRPCLQTGTVVRTTAIVTQLVFEHALRIRMKAETMSSPAATPTATPEAHSEVTTLDNGSVVEINIVSEEAGRAMEEPQSEPSTTAASRIKGKRKDESTGSDSSKEEGDKLGSPSNLVGRMNNLVLTDLENLVDVLYFLLQVVVCIWFLYNILGWRWPALSWTMSFRSARTVTLPVRHGLRRNQEGQDTSKGAC